MEFKDIVKSRYATKKFDRKLIPEEKVDELKDIIRYSASSFNMQPWKIKVVKDKDILKKLQAASWNQVQIGSCSHLFVFCADNDVISRAERLGKLMKEEKVPMIKRTGFMTVLKSFLRLMDQDKREWWAKHQVYIALGNAINGAKSLGFDSCPVEGFNAQKYSEILDLPETLVPVVAVPIGYAADKPSKKIRFSMDDVFF